MSIYDMSVEDRAVDVFARYYTALLIVPMQARERVTLTKVIAIQSVKDILDARPYENSHSSLSYWTEVLEHLKRQ